MTANKQILVVDDNGPVRHALKQLLEAAGYNVCCAVNGQDALNHLRRGERPFLILLDLSMPGMTGWEFRQEQRRDARLAAVPVVLVSGERDLSVIADSLEAAAYFRKPIEIPRLLEAVRRIGSCSCISA